MASKVNPSCLLLAWKLQGAFDLFVENPTKGGRVSQKNMGVVSKMSHSEKGKVENKVDQASCMRNTTAQEEGVAPYALQAAKLDYRLLRRDLKEAVQKGLQDKPTAGVLARQ